MNSILDFYKMKQQGEKITMMTCYDYTSACMLAHTEIDCILVGDSLGMVMHGYENTTSVTVELMALHTKAVRRGLKDKFIVADLPFLSYRKSLAHTMDAVHTLIQAGANAIKLEGAKGNEKTIEHIVESGIPVMGHLGLTPQFIHAFGGFKVQGKKDREQEALLEQAHRLAQAGCFGVVLECIPAQLAKQITDSINIATIGIGAGAKTDGQVLVFQDALGLQTALKPKYLEHFMEGEKLMQTAVNEYVKAVKSKAYPQAQHSY